MHTCAVAALSSTDCPYAFRSRPFAAQVEVNLVKQFFNSLDTDGNGVIDLDEFIFGVQRLGIPLPKKALNEDPEKRAP